MGVLTAHIGYSGSGDSGNVDECKIEWNKKEDQIPARLRREAQAVLQDLAFEQVSVAYETGWYNDSGGQGTVEVRLSGEKPIMEVDHNQNYTQTENYSATVDEFEWKT